MLESVLCILDQALSKKLPQNRIGSWNVDQLGLKFCCLGSWGARVTSGQEELPPPPATCLRGNRSYCYRHGNPDLDGLGQNPVSKMHSQKGGLWNVWSIDGTLVSVVTAEACKN